MAPVGTGRLSAIVIWMPGFSDSQTAVRATPATSGLMRFQSELSGLFINYGGADKTFLRKVFRSFFYAYGGFKVPFAGVSDKLYFKV